MLKSAVILAQYLQIDGAPLFRTCLPIEFGAFLRKEVFVWPQVALRCTENRQWWEDMNNVFEDVSVPSLFTEFVRSSAKASQYVRNVESTFNRLVINRIARIDMLSRYIETAKQSDSVHVEFLRDLDAKDADTHARFAYQLAWLLSDVVSSNISANELPDFARRPIKAILRQWWMSLPIPAAERGKHEVPDHRVEYSAVSLSFQNVAFSVTTRIAASMNCLYYSARNRECGRLPFAFARVYGLIRCLRLLVDEWNSFADLGRKNHFHRWLHACSSEVSGSQPQCPSYTEDRPSSADSRSAAEDTEQEEGSFMGLSDVSSTTADTCLSTDQTDKPTISCYDGGSFGTESIDVFEEKETSRASPSSAALDVRGETFRPLSTRRASLAICSPFKKDAKFVSWSVDDPPLSDCRPFQSQPCLVASSFAFAETVLRPAVEVSA